MIDAADPQAELHDYYRFRSETEDGGYLNSLGFGLPVHPHAFLFRLVQPYVLKKLVGSYMHQAYKHIHPDQREQARLPGGRSIARWSRTERNEFAAATNYAVDLYALPCSQP